MLKRIAGLAVAIACGLTVVRAADSLPRQVLSIDFEGEWPADFTLQRSASVTEEADRVLEGTRSLFVDTTAGTNTWNEFLWIAPGRLISGRRYAITLDYRWVEGKTGRAKIYAMLRSASKESAGAPDVGVGSKSADEFSGGLTGRIQRVVRIPSFPDYGLLVGLQDQGACSIDRLVIREVPESFRLPKPDRAPGPAGPPAHAKWVPWPEISDEFEGEVLDPVKWKPSSTFWKGRPPAYFDPRNVAVRSGGLELTIREADYENDPDLIAVRKANSKFHTWTSATVEGLADIRYGYFEIKARVANASCSSAFWFTGDAGTEIDVFEIGGNSPGYESAMQSAVHIFPKPWNQMAPQWARSTQWDAVERLADANHVYGLEWDREAMTFYLDGHPVGRIPNTNFHFPIKLLFDIETMPGWLGVPQPEDRLPAVYRIEYFRAWRRADAEASERAEDGGKDRKGETP
jgi:beta-glucanase (GH16 family)